MLEALPGVGAPLYLLVALFTGLGHMNPLAIEKARRGLRVATKALNELSTAKDYTTFADCWYTFLTSIKNIYTALEQGAKASPQSMQWIGGKKQERRNDDLLQYLFQARNDDEHGLQPVTEYVPEKIGLGVAKPGYSTSARYNITIKDGRISGIIQSLDGKPYLIERTPAHARLARVHGRGDVPFDPPTQHMGRPLASSLPVPVATLAIAYFESLVEEAGKLT